MESYIWKTILIVNSALVFPCDEFANLNPEDGMQIATQKNEPEEGIVKIEESIKQYL